MKKVRNTILSIAMLLSTATFSAISFDSITRKQGFATRHTSFDVGAVTMFSLQMALSGSKNQDGGLALPAVSLTTYHKAEKKRWTSCLSIGFQMGVTGKYEQAITGITESYAITAITLAAGKEYNWKDTPFKQIYSGAKAGYTFCQTTFSDFHPIYAPSFKGSTGQIDLIGFRGLTGKKKKMGYNVAFGAGYQGIIRAGLIQKF